VDVPRLDRIFKPQRIALVGVTENPKSVSGTVLRNLVGSGFRGVGYPVNPAFEAVAGVSCYGSVRESPRTPDLAVVRSPAGDVPDVVRASGEAGILGLVNVSTPLGADGPVPALKMMR
jgi:acetyltransferase